jgi:hypothetical protein
MRPESKGSDKPQDPTAWGGGASGEMPEVTGQKSAEVRVAKCLL